MSTVRPDDFNEPAVRLAQHLYGAGLIHAKGVLSFRTSGRSRFCVMAGINNFARWLEGFRMPPSFLVQLRQAEGFDEVFIEILRNERAIMNVFAMSEGEVVGPNTPVLELHGSLISLLLTYPKALELFRQESTKWTDEFFERESQGPQSLMEWNLELFTSADVQSLIPDSMGLIEGSGTAHVHRMLDSDGMMVCDQVDYRNSARPSDARSLLIRYADNSAVCRPLPDKTRSAAYHQQSIGEIGTPDELITGSRKIKVEVLS